MKKVEEHYITGLTQFVNASLDTGKLQAKHTTKQKSIVFCSTAEKRNIHSLIQKSIGISQEN